MSPQSDFESLSRQAWEAWSRQWQPFAGPAAGAPPAPATGPGLEQALESLNGYLAWMQQAATAGLASPVMPPVAQPFGPGSPWMQAAMGGLGAAAGAGTPWGASPTAMPGLDGGIDAPRSLLQAPAFGHTREQQAQQQALLLAALDYQQASQRYQALMARAQGEAAARLQARLAAPEAKVETLKALYDLWVDAFEEAYAGIALSDEFQQVYGELVNAQMRMRQLQQRQVEAACRALGLPTREDVDTLGRRLQELRRELRELRGTAAGGRADDGAAAKTPRPAVRGKRQTLAGDAAPGHKPAARTKAGKDAPAPKRSSSATKAGKTAAAKSRAKDRKRSGR